MASLPPVVCRYGPGVLVVRCPLGHCVPIAGGYGETRRVFDSVSGVAYRSLMASWWGRNRRKNHDQQDQQDQQEDRTNI